MSLPFAKRRIFLCYTLFLFLLGAFAYGCIEIAWRGWTHPSMLLLGGICLCFLSALRRTELPRFLCCILGALTITAFEYLFGFFLNLVLRLHIWDYSKEPFSLHGQICLRYTVYWFFLTFPAFWLCALCDRLFLFPLLSKAER